MMMLRLLLTVAGIGLLTIQSPFVQGITECAYGKGLNSKGKCELCPVGTYSSGYTPAGKNLKCLRCPPGTTSPLATMFKSFCTKCKALRAGKDGKCRRCPKGTYTSEPGSLQCTKCTKLRGVGHESFRGCRMYAVCKPGMQTFLKICPYNTCWLDSKQCCVDSEDGTTCVQKLTDKCPGGSGIDKDDVCDVCPFKYYRPKPTSPPACLPCPPGTEADRTQTKCVPCASAYYNDKPGYYCRLCPQGTYSIQTSKTVGPTKCTGRCPTPKIIRDPLKPCNTYITCKPGFYASVRSCSASTCVNAGKKCCADPVTGKCLYTF